MTRHKRRFKLRSIYLWHRYVGVSAALLVIVLSITGVLLNHTEELRLDQRYLQNDFLLDWYGIEETAKIRNFRAGDSEVSELSGALYLNGLRLEGEFDGLQGTVVTDGIILVALQRQVLLATGDGELIDRLPVPLAAGPIEQIGTDRLSRIFLRSANSYLAVNGELTGLQRVVPPAEQPRWSIPQKLHPDTRNLIVKQFRARILDWERVLLDLHSGRIFGNWGVWMMDIAALLLLLLAMSGLFLWINQRRKRRLQQRQRRF